MNVNHVVYGVDKFAKYFWAGLGIFFVIFVVWWIYRMRTIAEDFFKNAAQILGGAWHSKGRILPFYSPNEIQGSYKGREVSVGVIYSGINGEFLPLPYIRMRLTESFGYNINRLPHYATIEKNFLVYHLKVSILWGLLDKNYPQLFSKNYLLVVLDKMVVAADDVERGKTFKEILK